MITLLSVGPKPDTFPRQPANNGHSTSGRITALVLGADESRMYAGSHAGMWRSDDGGQSWFQPTWAQPPLGVAQAEIPGALYAPHIFDLATSPEDVDIVLASALDSQFLDGRDGVYLSEDGGESWTLVLKPTPGPNAAPFNVVFAPDDPQLVYAVGTGVGRFFSKVGIVAISRDAGKSWETTSVGSSLAHVAVAPLDENGRRRVYAIGDSVIWYSGNGGLTWASDGGVATITAARAQLSAFQAACQSSEPVGPFGEQTAYAAGDAPQILAVEPGDPSRVYLASAGVANGPTYYSAAVKDGTTVNTDCSRLAGEGSLWVGDFSEFENSGKAANWSLLLGPPVYSGYTSPSGNRYVTTQPTSTGFLLFFSDNSHVHVSVGTPTSSASWHRLDGMDASKAKAEGYDLNMLFMHADPHAIAFTRDFEITLKPPAAVQDPYDKNSELDEHIAGTLWMANDGGVYRCDDGGREESSWQLATGLETLDPVNIAGLGGLGSTPALYFGCGDNNDFFTRDGGAHWGDPKSGCGDCDAWFSDPAQPHRVLQLLPRRSDAAGFAGFIGIINSDGSSYPDAEDEGSKTFIPSPKKQNFQVPTKLSPFASSDVYLIGYRPLIQTLSSEAPSTDGDVVIIEQALNGTANLFRTTSISSIKTVQDWHDASKATQVGPTLPAGAIAVQASGGHESPAYYIRSRGGQVWKLSHDETEWSMIVPSSTVGGPPVTYALQWFVNPYDPNEIYVLDAQGVKLSIDAGDSWIFDTAMTDALTCGGYLQISPSLLQDMQFSRVEPPTRFAMGTAGVFYTIDFGISWLSALSSIAVPGRPESAFFDPISDQADRAIYVGCEGRGILRVGGLPAPTAPQPPQALDLMAFAALDY